MQNKTTPQDGDRKTDSTIKSVHKALDIIDYVSKCPQGTSVKDLSDGLGINKSTISKMLSTMEMHGYVQQDARTHRYRIGFQPLLIAKRASGSNELQSIADPYLLDLRDQTGETVSFAMYSNMTLTYVATYEASYPVRLSSTVGMRASLTGSAVGKATLAFLQEPDRTKLLQRIAEAPESPAFSMEEFLRKLEKVRHRGYSINIDELTKGVSGVGAPIFDCSNNLVAAVAVAGLSARLNEDLFSEYGRLLVDTCRHISEDFGYQAEK